MAFPPLRRLRLRLLAWQLVTLSALLLLLGGGLFLAIRRQVTRQLADSLHDATTELERATRIREQEAGASGQVVDAVDELHIPDRTLILLDTVGRPIKPAGIVPEPWIGEAARRAARDGTVDLEHELHGERMLMLHGERFTLSRGTPLVAIAMADRVELEDRYAALIATFGAAALVALVLVAAAGSLLVRQATAPIEQSVEQMRRFMADAAHELRTPLSVLRSQAEVALQQVRAPAEYAAALHGIEHESQRLGRIVEDLLMLARADAGERPIERRRVFLDDIAMDAAAAAGAVAGTRGVTLRMEEVSEAPVQGDPELLRRLLLILLDNAVKFTPAGGRVTVAVGCEGAEAVVRVVDTGAGIAADQLPHVFERFYRGDHARGRTAASGDAPGGAGLGLAIAQWIATVHDAAITIRSTPGHGTTVVVRIPLDAGPPAVSSS